MVSAETIYTIDTQEFGFVEVSIVPLTPQQVEMLNRPNVQSITTNPGVLEPGQSATVLMGLNIPDCSQTTNCPGKSGRIELIFKKDGLNVNNILVQSACPTDYYGCSLCKNYACAQSIGVSVKFNAPSTLGTYEVRYQMRNNDGGGLVQETTTFTVANQQPTECTQDPYWGSWKHVYYVTHGDYQSRTYYKIGEPPACTPYVYNTDYRTVCDGGYVIEGTDVSSASGKHQCEKQDVCEPNLVCTKGDCIDGIGYKTCSDGCNPAYEDTEACGSCQIVESTCGDWGACSYNIQSRSCADSCGFKTHKETRDCTDPGSCTPNDDFSRDCGNGQTIVEFECVGGIKKATGAKCEDDNPCNNNNECQPNIAETWANCPKDCEKPSVTCRAYEVTTEDNQCKFDFGLLFQEQGLADFWDDYQTETVVGIGMICVILALIVANLWRK